jgi:hypothetical protein
MFARITAAMWQRAFVGLALALGNSLPAELFSEGSFQVADETKVPDAPDRIPPKTRAITIQLQELPDFSDEKTPLDDYCQRIREKLTEPYLEEVGESLRLEKQIDPIQVFKNTDGKWGVVTGHRRVAAMYLQMKKQVAGFTPGMAVAALELIDSTPEDRLIRSVADNEVRQKLDQKERLLVTQKFAKAGVSKDRGAAGLAISVKSYERDLRVATQPRMLEHVLKDHLAPGDGSTLIQAAEKHHRATEFYDYLDGWVKRTEAKIVEEDHISKAETNKGLKPADLLVKNSLTQSVFDGWLEAFERKTPFTDSAEFNFEATLDKKSGKLRIERLNVDTQDADALDLIKLGAKLSQLSKRVLAVAQRKQQIESLSEMPGPQATLAQDPSPYDTEVLKQFGMSNAAKLLEQEVQADKKAVDDSGDAPEEDATEGQ